MLFDDGLVKVLKGHRMLKANAVSMQSSPLFLPASGTKQERRDKKRKLNVTALFNKKMKMNTPLERKRKPPQRKLTAPVRASPPPLTPLVSATSAAPANSPASDDSERWLPT